MAWANIDERRQRVKELMDAGTTINTKVRRELAQEFACSVGAIAADLIALNRQQDTPIYMSANMRKRIYARDGRVCQYCGSTTANEYIIEHVIPAAQGGIARPHNLVVACVSCNNRKRRRVWIPANFAAITEDYPEWKSRVESLAQNP